MKSYLRFAVLLLVAVVAISCGGNSTLDNSEASVFLTIDISEYSPEVNVCNNTNDITISQMNVDSHPKDPGASLTATADVLIDRWVITPSRTDGGTVTSPPWSFDQGIYVSAGGNASLSNWPVYPYEMFFEPPLDQLLPENGGIDSETGNQNIRQALTLVMYGETVSGKSVATEPIRIQFNFRCN